MTQSRIKLLTKMADKHGCTLSQLAVAWCLRNSTSQSVIASANSTEQLLEILGSLPVIYINRSSRRKRGMASNPLFIIPDFFCIFPMMATLGLKEMEKFLWEGREKSLPRAELFPYLPKGIFAFLSNLRQL